MLILLTSIRIAILNPLIDPNSEFYYRLYILFVLLTVMYSLIALFNIIAFGFKDYIKSSFFHLFHLIITFTEIILLISNIDHYIGRVITSLRIL